MPTFRIRLGTAFQATATDDELVTVFATIAAAGGTSIEVVRNTGNGRPRAEFLLGASDRPNALAAVGRIAADLTELTPSVPDGWVLVTLVPG